MSEPLELPTELRWRCQKCGKDVQEAQCVSFIGHGALARLAGGAYDFSRGAPEGPDPSLFTTLEKLALIPFMPLSGPPERGHEILWTTGGRAGVMGGWTQHTDVCGPVRLTLIETQELFVEWAMRGGWS